MKTFRFIPLSTRRVPSRRQVAKAVRRWWLQVTAPKWAREVWLKNRKKKSVRVCDMNDRHLLNTIVWLERESEKGFVFGYGHFQAAPRPILNVMVREASRRGLRSALAEIEAGRLPKWLEESNAAWAESARAKRDKRAKKRAAEVMPSRDAAIQRKGATAPSAGAARSLATSTAS